MENREYGSDFHYIERSDDHVLFNPFLENGFKLHFSGRVALYNILKEGIEKYRWHRVGFPSYYCHEVVEFCGRLPIDVIYYDYNPFDSDKVLNWLDIPGSVFVNVDFFGIRKLDVSFLKNSVIIEDLTHNFLALASSQADYCFASLRKQFPIGIGGVAVGVKSKLYYTEINSAISEGVSIQRFVAMFLKAEYLSGKFNDKNFFRALFAESELFFKSEHSDAGMPVFFRELFFSIDHQKLIQRTRDNVDFAVTLLKHKHFSVFGERSVSPLGMILIFNDSMKREELRFFLIERKIYPAILWPDQKFENDVFFSNRMLFIHLDFRYTKNDVLNIVSVINEFYVNDI